MNRDWDKDMELFEEGIKQARELGFSPTIESSPYRIAIHWLQQYAIEKQRADIAELAYKGLAEDCVTSGEYQSLMDKHTTMTKAHWAQKLRADKAEAEAEKWRREALQKYPTPDAYDAACKALQKHRVRADRTEIALLQLQESIAWIKTKHEFEWTYEPGIGEVVYDIINVLENGTGVLEGKE